MEYGNRIVSHADPQDVTAIDPPRSAVVTSELYDGSVPTLPVWAVARAAGWVCVKQRIGPEQHWVAWVPADRVKPV
jgi:hypothetical protein